MKTILFAAFTAATVTAQDVTTTTPVFPVASGSIQSAEVIGNIWSVKTTSGDEHHGYTVPAGRSGGISFTVDETAGTTTAVQQGPGYRFIDKN